MPIYRSEEEQRMAEESEETERMIRQIHEREKQETIEAIKQGKIKVYDKNNRRRMVESLMRMTGKDLLQCRVKIPQAKVTFWESPHYGTTAEKPHYHYTGIMGIGYIMRCRLGEIGSSAGGIPSDKIPALDCIVMAYTTSRCTSL